jgi:hypothetical protein
MTGMSQPTDKYNNYADLHLVLPLSEQDNSPSGNIYPNT